MEQFSFEGHKRCETAKAGLKNLKSECDSVVVIPNDRIPNIDANCPLNECFKLIDGVFSRVINGIAGVIIPSGENDINLDFADLQTIMIHRGIAVIGIGEHQGKNAAYEAINNAMKFTMADGLTMKSASGVLVHFNMHPEFHFMELSAAMEVIHKSVDESAAGVEKSFMLVANNVYQ
jgi:cell division protein FtsZ